MCLRVGARVIMGGEGGRKAQPTWYDLPTLTASSDAPSRTTINLFSESCEGQYIKHTQNTMSQAYALSASSDSSSDHDLWAEMSGCGLRLFNRHGVDRLVTQTGKTSVAR